MKGLAPHTQQIFEAVSKLDCIKPYLFEELLLLYLGIMFLLLLIY